MPSDVVPTLLILVGVMFASLLEMFPVQCCRCILVHNGWCCAHYYLCDGNAQLDPILVKIDNLFSLIFLQTNYNLNGWGAKCVVLSNLFGCQWFVQVFVTLAVHMYHLLKNAGFLISSVLTTQPSIP